MIGSWWRHIMGSKRVSHPISLSATCASWVDMLPRSCVIFRDVLMVNPLLVAVLLTMCETMASHRVINKDHHYSGVSGWMRSAFLLHVSICKHDCRVVYTSNVIIVKCCVRRWTGTMRGIVSMTSAESAVSSTPSGRSTHWTLRRNHRYRYVTNKATRIAPDLFWTTVRTMTLKSGLHWFESQPQVVK